MSHKDETGLAWSGRPPPKRSGGFVDGVSMNAGPQPLAVDPNGVVGPVRPRGGPVGPQVTLTRMDAGSDGPVQPSGRVRLTPT